MLAVLIGVDLILFGLVIWLALQFDKLDKIVRDGGGGMQITNFNLIMSKLNGIEKAAAEISTTIAPPLKPIKKGRGRAALLTPSLRH